MIFYFDTQGKCIAADGVCTDYHFAETMAVPEGFDPQPLVGLEYEMVRRHLTDTWDTIRNRRPWNVVPGNGWQQEWYKTSSRQAGRRARELRKLGFAVTCSAMGYQQTRVGRIRLTLVDIRNPEGREIPRPER